MLTLKLTLVLLLALRIYSCLCCMFGLVGMPLLMWLRAVRSDAMQIIWAMYICILLAAAQCLLCGDAWADSIFNRVVLPEI